MIESKITEKDGARSSVTTIICDMCGKGLRFGPGKPSVTPRGTYAKFLLKQKGWAFNKRHTCSTCCAKKDRTTN